MADPRGEVTVLLDERKLGSKDALAKLMPLVYRELRRVAGGYMRDERPGHTLQPTALVHEAFLRLVEQDRAIGRTAPNSSAWPRNLCASWWTTPADATL